MPSWQLDEQVRIPAEAAAPVSRDEGTAPPDYEMHFLRGPDGKIASPIRLSIKPLANFAMRVFERKELLEIIESAAWEPLRGLVQYLIAAQYGQDEREAEALAQLTDAVLAGPWATAGEPAGPQ